MFSLDHVPDDILLEILARMHTSEMFAATHASSPTVALRSVALTCWRLYNLTRRSLMIEMWWTGKDGDQTEELMLTAIDPSDQQAFSPGYAQVAQKVVISLLPSKNAVHRRIYAALPQFASLKELILADTAISAEETYPVLASLSALRIFAALRCTLVQKIDDFGLQRDPQTIPTLADLARFNFNQLKLTHLAVSIVQCERGSRLSSFINILFMPTLQEVDFLWTKETAVACMRQYNSLPLAAKSAAFGALTCLTLRIPRLDLILVQHTILLLRKWPRHPTYDGPLTVGGAKKHVDVHLRVGICKLSRDTWEGEDSQVDITHIDILGPATQQLDIAVAGSLAPVSSYEGPLTALGLIISPSPVIYGGNIISKKEWARVECTPEPLGVDAVNMPRQVQLENWNATNATDSGLKRLIITKNASSVVSEAQHMSHALTLLAVGRVSATALPNGTKFILMAPNARLYAGLQHIDIYIQTFDLEALYAVRALFWRTLESLVIRLPEYPSNAGFPLYGAFRALVHEESIGRVISDFLAHMPYLRSILILNHERLETKNLRDLTVDEIHQDVKEYTIGWGSLCLALREVQMDEARFCRRWEGDTWLKMNAHLIIQQNRPHEAILQMY